MNEERNSVLNYLIMKRIFLIKFNLIKMKNFENTEKKDKLKTFEICEFKWLTGRKIYSYFNKYIS